MGPLFIRFCMHWEDESRDFYELVEQRKDGSFKSVIGYTLRQDVLDYAARNFPGVSIGEV